MDDLERSDPLQASRGPETPKPIKPSAKLAHLGNCANSDYAMYYYSLVSSNSNYAKSW